MGELKVIDFEELEDGGANIKFEFDNETLSMLVQHALLDLIKKGIASE